MRWVARARFLMETASSGELGLRDLRLPCRRASRLCVLSTSETVTFSPLGSNEGRCPFQKLRRRHRRGRRRETRDRRRVVRGDGRRRAVLIAMRRGRHARPIETPGRVVAPSPRDVRGWSTERSRKRARVRAALWPLRGAVFRSQSPCRAPSPAEPGGYSAYGGLGFNREIKRSSGSERGRGTPVAPRPMNIGNG